MGINDGELVAREFLTLQNNFIVPMLKFNGPSLTNMWTEEQFFLT